MSRIFGCDRILDSLNSPWSFEQFHGQSCTGGCEASMSSKYDCRLSILCQNSMLKSTPSSEEL